MKDYYIFAYANERPHYCEYICAILSPKINLKALNFDLELKTLDQKNYKRENYPFSNCQKLSPHFESKLFKIWHAYH